MIGGSRQDIIEGGPGVDFLTGNISFGSILVDRESDVFVFSELSGDSPDVDVIDLDRVSPDRGGDILDFSAIVAALPDADLVAFADGAGNSLIGVYAAGEVQVWAWVFGVSDPSVILDDNIVI